MNVREALEKIKVGNKVVYRHADKVRGHVVDVQDYGEHIVVVFLDGKGKYREYPMKRIKVAQNRFVYDHDTDFNFNYYYIDTHNSVELSGCDLCMYTCKANKKCDLFTERRE